MRQNKNVRNWIEQKELWERSQKSQKSDKIDFAKVGIMFLPLVGLGQLQCKKNI